MKILSMECWLLNGKMKMVFMYGYDEWALPLNFVQYFNDKKKIMTLPSMVGILFTLRTMNISTDIRLPNKGDK